MITERRAYHYAPITPDATAQAHCVTEGCNFRADVGPDGRHGHDPSHDVVLMPVDYTAHPLYRETHDRLRQLREAQGHARDRNPRGVQDVP